MRNFYKFWVIWQIGKIVIKIGCFKVLFEVTQFWDKNVWLIDTVYSFSQS